MAWFKQRHSSHRFRLPSKSNLKPLHQAKSGELTHQRIVNLFDIDSAMKISMPEANPKNG